MDVVIRRLAALFSLGIIAFYSPVLVALNRGQTILGFPVLPFYLFGVWSLLVAGAWACGRRGRR